MPARYRRFAASGACVGAMSHRPFSGVPSRAAKHAAEFETGPAQPVDRTVQADQSRRFAVADDGVILNSAAPWILSQSPSPTDARPTPCGCATAREYWRGADWRRNSEFKRRPATRRQGGRRHAASVCGHAPLWPALCAGPSARGAAGLGGHVRIVFPSVGAQLSWRAMTIQPIDTGSSQSGPALAVVSISSTRARSEPARARRAG